MVFTESLLHFIWRFRLFDSLDLKTEEGLVLHIEDVGQYNQNAGPDFEYARIRIDGTLWIGQIEIHVQECDWLLHGHEQDKNYDNTILHVAWELSDKLIKRSDGTSIPTLVLKDKVDSSMLGRYEQLMQNLDWVPCEKQLLHVKELTIQSWLSRMAVARLEQKFESVESLLHKTNQDWERVFMIVLGRSFGMKVNAEAFEALCSNLNLTCLQKYQQDSLKIESLLFGQAGFLQESSDDYSSKLKLEFDYLQSLHQLNVMRKEDWRFLRMRPCNFPTYRLGQLAALLIYKSYWFAYVLEVDSCQELFEAIDKAEVNAYWGSHYRFGAATKEHSVAWSLSFKVHLMINCFVPMLFAYGSFMKIDKYKDKALDWLNELPAEINQITKGFASYNVKCYNAADSQALLFLKKEYCDRKQCLDCAIGLAILKS